MSISKLWRVLGAVAAAYVLAGTAQAAAVASGSITGLTFNLLDLDASDGIAPSLSWSSPFALTEVGRQFGQAVHLVPLAGGGFTWNVTFSQSAPAYSNSDSSVFLAGLDASLPGAAGSIAALALTADATASSGETLSAYAYGSGSFLLSANTELIVSAILGSQGSGASAAGFGNPAGVDGSIGARFSQALGYAELALGSNVVFSRSEGANYTPSTDPATYPVDAFARSDSRPVELRWRNDSAASASGDFYALVQADSTEIAALGPTAVPEPSSAALALLALAAARLGRRRGR